MDFDDRITQQRTCILQDGLEREWTGFFLILQINSVPRADEVRAVVEIADPRFVITDRRVEISHERRDATHRET